MGSTAPLTERILARLPGPRVAWILAWVLVPWLNLALVATSGATERGRTGISTIDVLNRSAASVALALALWGTARLAEELRELQPALTRAVEEDEPDVRRLFGGVGSVAAPALLVVAVGLVLPLDEALRGEPSAALIQLVTWLIIGIPFCTAFWAYLILQVGLDRLGRGHLTLKAYSGDRSLGLKPVGRLAFTGFWMIFGVVGPLLLTGFSDTPGMIVAVMVLLAAVMLFFLSLRRLNRRMVAIKRSELDRALDLYREAYERVREGPLVEVLEQHASALSAAEAMEKRAERIQEWPFDEAVFARVVTIASTVAAAIIARAILAQVGL